MKSDKTVFVLVPPDPDSSGKYALLVSRGGFGAQPVVLFVDRMIEGEESYTAMLGKQKVASFPKPTPFLMLARAYMALMSPTEVAQMHKDEETSVNAVLNPEGPMIPVEVSHPGQFL